MYSTLLFLENPEVSNNWQEKSQQLFLGLAHYLWTLLLKYLHFTRCLLQKLHEDSGQSHSSSSRSLGWSKTHVSPQPSERCSLFFPGRQLFSLRNQDAKASVKLAGLPRDCLFCCPKAISRLDCICTCNGCTFLPLDRWWAACCLPPANINVQFTQQYSTALHYSLRLVQWIPCLDFYFPVAALLKEIISNVKPRSSEITSAHNSHSCPNDLNRLWDTSLGELIAQYFLQTQVSV